VGERSSEESSDPDEPREIIIRMMDDKDAKDARFEANERDCS